MNSTGTKTVDPAIDLAAYDRLPAVLRQALATAPVNMSAEQVEQFWRYRGVEATLQQIAFSLAAHNRTQAR